MCKYQIYSDISSWKDVTLNFKFINILNLWVISELFANFKTMQLMLQFTLIISNFQMT